ncbi:MAG: FAD-dependent oxidoreductase [Luteolibacter sp.]|uniref:FAD-dependent oxidoreductase n=1 Tax=Luteolibacter sp. TaxID=1962973 RepID=UPI0032667224
MRIHENPVQSRQDTASPRDGFGQARRDAFQSANGGDYDVAVIGAGISGSRIFHQLCQRGYRVLLIDRGDFACGTSQASGMMIWGGLLYLKDLDFSTVKKLSAARDEWIERAPAKVRAASLLYLPGRKSLRNRYFVQAGMMLYWLMGSMKRRFPGSRFDFSELNLLKAGRFRNGLSFEEAVLRESDSRFALEWILPFLGPRTTALNHCAAENMIFDRSSGVWRLDLRDRLHGHQSTAKVRFIVNAAGVWTDSVNGMLGVESPYRHELSKGVYISVRRPDSLQQILIFDTGENGDTFTVSPWGPVALCGPTETRVTRIGEGFRPTPDDVRSLLRISNENLDGCRGVDDVVSLRCGIRPLAVCRGFSKITHPLELSRRHLIHHDRSRNVISVYGGKLTSCGVMGEQVSALVSPLLHTGQIPSPSLLEAPPMESFPGVEDPVPSAEWCRDYEHCWTLEDYLRRRTNIAQWIPRGGLGHSSGNVEAIRRIARVFSPDPDRADASVADYQDSVRVRHDDVLAIV